MKRFTTVFALVLVTSGTHAVTISGGTKGGSYDRWARNLAMLTKGLGYKPTAERSKGAQENVERVASGEADVAFTQGDVLMATGGQGVEILAEIGKECVFLVGNTDGRVRDEDDLQSDDAHTIAVGKRGTGSQVTWSYMGQLEPGYTNSAAQYVGGARALGKVSAGQLDAAMFVTAPGNLDHRLIVAVNSDERLEFIDVDDKDLNDKLPNGTPVYTFEEIDTKAGWGGGVDTICTPVLAIANPDADEDLLDDLAQVFMSNKAAVLQ